MNKKKLSIILSFYNEEENIKLSVEKLINVLHKISEIDYEIIYVNDCSTDNSLNLLKEENLKNHKIKIINLSRRFGHMAGIMAGLRNCSGDAAVYIDIDLQDPPELIHEMVKHWLNDNCDVVFTTRKSRPENFFMKTLTKIGYSILKQTTDINITKDLVTLGWFQEE